MCLTSSWHGYGWNAFIVSHLSDCSDIGSIISISGFMHIGRRVCIGKNVSCNNNLAWCLQPQPQPRCKYAIVEWSKVQISFSICSFLLSSPSK